MRIQFTEALPYALGPGDEVYVPEVGTVHVRGMNRERTEITVERVTNDKPEGDESGAYWRPRWTARREVVTGPDGFTPSSAVVHAFEIGRDGQPSQTSVCGIPPLTPNRPITLRPVRSWHSFALDFGDGLGYQRCDRCWSKASLATPGGGPWQNDLG